MLPKTVEELLLKYLDNNCTPHEASIVMEWMATPEGKVFAENQFDSDAAAIGKSHKLFEQPEVRSVQMFQQILAETNTSKASRTTRITPIWLKIAAAILIPVLITSAIMWLVKEKPQIDVAWQEVYVPKGEKMQMMFQDGTRVWLNSDTKLKYPVNFTGNLREVKLEGEAYFVVNKNANKPFFVRMNNLSVKVTGTSFNVKAYSNENSITATLDEGKISLLTNKNNKQSESILNPMEQATFSKESAEIAVKPVVVGQNSSWKNNELSFNDTPFLDVIRILERWYNVNVTIADKELATYTYTLNYGSESLTNVLTAMARITPIKYSMKNGAIVIKLNKK